MESDGNGVPIHPGRDARGKFVAGCKGGPGRRRGSGNAVDRALHEILFHFLRGDRKGRAQGMAALDVLLQKSPVTYSKLVARVLVEVAGPRDRRSRTRAYVEGLRRLVSDGGGAYGR